MSLDQIDIHNEYLPETFNNQVPPDSFDENYLVLPADGVHDDGLSDFEQDAFVGGNKEAPTAFVLDVEENEHRGSAGPPPAPGFGIHFPGMPVIPAGGQFRTPSDAYAFYLPFHLYYDPDFWGIYLIAERVAELTNELYSEMQHASRSEVFKAVRFYLFKHEYFHQKVESFSARMEVTHRSKVFLRGQQVIHKKTLGTDDCLEEALAEAYAYKELESALSDKWKLAKKKQSEIMDAFKRFVEDSPPGYKLGVEYADDETWKAKRHELAEQIHQEALTSIREMPSELWRMFGHGFRAIGNINSKVNYVVHEDSDLAQRMQLGMKRMAYGKLRKKLKNHCGCEVHREGRGSHVIWKAPSGETFTVPRHSRDLATGTLSSIVKAACNGMNLHDFMRA